MSQFLCLQTLDTQIRKKTKKQETKVVDIFDDFRSIMKETVLDNVNL